MEYINLNKSGMNKLNSKSIINHTGSKVNTSLLIFYVLLIFKTTLSAQDTQGFFLDDSRLKVAAIPQYEEYSQPSTPPDVSVFINFSDTIAKISKYIYGNNSNIYMGQMVTEPDLIKYIKNLSPNIIRYPGGNLTNLFFWDESKKKRPANVPDTIINGKQYPGEYWYGRNTDSFTMSVDNYYLMLKHTKSTGLICVNFGYARYGMGTSPVQSAAHLAANWVRYDKGRTKFWEIGNENYGPWQAGFQIDTVLNNNGQPKIISGELYGTYFKIFADSMRSAAKEIRSKIEIGAVIVEVEKPKSWYNPVEANWNKGFFKTAGNYSDFFAIHSYFTPYMENSTPATILNSANSETLRMMEYMKKMCSDFNVKLKPIALTEWNIFAVNSKQSCSFISGMHAVLVLGELAKNKYGEASRWDFANGYAKGDDHGMFNIGDEADAPKWNPRPAYFYMYYFQKFFGNLMISSTVQGSDDIVVFASKFSSGQVGVVIINKGATEKTVNLDVINFKAGKRYYLYSLTGGKDNGDFSQCVFVNGHAPDNETGGPIKNLENIKAFASSTNKNIVLSSPEYSVQYILVDNDNK